MLDRVAELDSGILLGKNGEPDQRVILLSLTDDCATWSEAIDFAHSVNGVLPSCRALALLKANRPEEFKAEWYWSSEALTGPQRGCAWAQNFTHGRQAYLLKTDEINVRVVRYVPI
jgi:hypothetical protein